MTRARVAICTAAVGHGHCRAAEVISDVLSPRFEVARFEALSYAPRWFNGVYRNGYLRVIRTIPSLQRWIYDRTDHVCDGTSAGEGIERFAMRKFLADVMSFRPDIVFCTHFLCARVISEAIKRGTLKSRLAVCVTDLHPHGVWLTKNADRYLVACSSAADRVESLGLGKTKTRAVGIPVHPDFGSVSRESARAKLRIPHNASVVLFTGGGLGLGGIDEAVRAAAIEHPDLFVIAVCGRDDSLRARLDDMMLQFRAPHRIYGFTDDMPTLMAASDVLVGKPGGLTTAEALASDLPMVLLNPIPGQEEANARMLTASGVAELAANPAAAGVRAVQLALDPTAIDRMRRCIRETRSRFDAHAVLDAACSMIGAA
jgi:processive 1,2-diacylglycerol beta-glucosyltransferase